MIRPVRLLLPVGLSTLLAVAGCSSGAPPAPPAAGATGGTTASPSGSGRPSSSAPAPAEPQVLATGLEAPWGLAFLPGGDALISERDTARVLRLPARGGRPVEVARLSETRPGGEGGLLGLAVGPTYARDGIVHAYLTAERDNRVVRFRLPPGGGPASAPEPVLSGIPKASIHNGGRLAFGPDGALYVATGDAAQRGAAQDPESLGGKILRMTPEGRPVAGADSLVFSSGHRNVQGLAFDRAGRLWATEFGQNRYDEVNLVREGDNGGWPEVEGPGDGDGRFAAPLVTWSTEDASPSGAAVAGDSLWVAALGGERLWQVPLDGRGGVGEPEALFEGRYGRLRTVALASDGSLWLTTSNRDGRGSPEQEDDRVLRIAVPGGTGAR